MLYAAKIAALAGVYYGAAKLGLELAFETSSVTAVWPPTGIALAALVLGGYRLWPGVALGAILANSWTGIPIYAVLGITAGNTLEALAGAYLLRRVAGFRPSLERVTDVLALVGLAGLLSTMVSATLGVSSLLAAGEISSGAFGSVWRTWWLGDMGGDLVVAPAILVAVTHWPFRRARDRPLEAAAVVLLTGAVAALVFTQTTNLTFLFYPILIWACLRFRQLGAVIVCLLLAAVAIPLTAADLGPFSGNPPDDRLLLAQTYVGVASITALVLAAVVAERRRVEETFERDRDHPPGKSAPRTHPTFPASRWRWTFVLPESVSSSVAISTTGSRTTTEAGRWRLGTSPARAPRPRQPRPSPATRCERPRCTSAGRADPRPLERGGHAPVSRPDLHGRLRPDRVRQGRRRPDDARGGGASRAARASSRRRGGARGARNLAWSVGECGPDRLPRGSAPRRRPRLPYRRLDRRLRSRPHGEPGRAQRHRPFVRRAQRPGDRRPDRGRSPPRGWREAPRRPSSCPTVSLPGPTRDPAAWFRRVPGRVASRGLL